MKWALEEQLPIDVIEVVRQVLEISILVMVILVHLGERLYLLGRNYEAIDEIGVLGYIIARRTGEGLDIFWSDSDLFLLDKGLVLFV